MRFYARLLEEFPEWKPLFARTDFGEQRQQLVRAISLVVRAGSDSPLLVNYLGRLGQRHAAFSVGPRDYAAFSEILLETFAETAGQAVWSPDVADAWEELLEDVTRLMLTGAAAAELAAPPARPPLRTPQSVLAAATSATPVSIVIADRSTHSSSRVEREAATAGFQEDAFVPTNGHHPGETVATDGSAALQGDPEQFFGMVDAAPVSMLFVQQDGIVSYLNQRGHELFRELADEFGFEPEELVGGPVSRLFEHLPELQKALRTLTVPRRIRLKLGKEFLDIDLGTVVDSRGKRLGIFQRWNLCTERVFQESIESMLDNMPTNVLLADADLTLTYMNPASRKKLQELQQYLPLPVDQLTGKSIDIFHRNPPFQRGLLANPEKSLPHRASIQVGPETLDLLVSAVRDKTGKYLGPMVTWDVITEKLANEAEMIRVQNMMESIPINVLLANRDFELVYMNPASRNTLKKLEHLLPRPVDQLIGQKIDIFHKQPEHQRRLLSDPNNLPHRAKIRLAEETLDLLVSPILDKNRAYIGPMVTWSIVTNQVRLADDFERDVRGVVEIVTASASELQVSSRGMASVSKETARQAQVVASASDEATRNVETVASAAEELSSSIAEIARHVQDASRISGQAVQEANKTNHTIQELGESSQQIGQVVKVISSIAQQTNLLALNATIEAARAGEAGKGFAVVANEVKELARQTARATDEISQKVEAIQSATNVAISAIGSIGGIIGRINEISMTIASAVEQQSAATNEISRNVTEAARGTADVTNNIGGVSRAANEAGRGAGDILTAAESLTQEFERLDRVATEFLARMRKL